MTYEIAVETASFEPVARLYTVSRWGRFRRTFSFRQMLCA